MKLSHLNGFPDQLSWIETGEEPTNNEDGLLDAQLFRVEMVDDYYEQIVQFLVTRTTLKELTISQKKQLVIKATYFQLIVGKLYILGLDEILR